MEITLGSNAVDLTGVVTEVGFTALDLLGGDDSGAGTMGAGCDFI